MFTRIHCMQNMFTTRLVREIDRKRERQRQRQRDRETDRQTDRECVSCVCVTAKIVTWVYLGWQCRFLSRRLASENSSSGQGTIFDGILVWSHRYVPCALIVGYSVQEMLQSHCMLVLQENEFERCRQLQVLIKLVRPGLRAWLVLPGTVFFLY